MKKILKAIGNYIKTIPASAKIIGVAILLLIAAVITTGTAFSKYITQKEVSGVYSAGAKLADSFKLLEHKAEVQTDGSYVLDGDTTVLTNRYKLIPGLTIPKDPYIEIVGKTAIGSYLYLEVLEENISAELTYTVDNANWTLLSGVTGPHGGAVYAYKNGALIDNTTTGLDHISVLSGDSFTLSKTPVTGESEALTFCGYLVQPAEGESSAAAAFAGKFPAVTTP